LRQVAEAIKLMAERNHVVAEGAGAVAVAAALSGHYTQNKVCAVVSGGNLDGQVLASILQGRMPN
jgi:threonine dehydratase